MPVLRGCQVVTANRCAQVRLVVGMLIRGPEATLLLF